MAKNPFDRDGPIPGENFTSDTKNYAWHRPPQYTDLDQAIDYCGKKLMGEDESYQVITMVQTGAFTLADITQILVMQGLMSGKWTLDFGLLLAGPICHILKLMCEAYEVDYDIGIDKKTKVPGKAIFEAMNKPKAQSVDPEEAVLAAREAVMAEKKSRGGVMGAMPKGAANPQVQDAMLGNNPEPEVV